MVVSVSRLVITKQSQIYAQELVAECLVSEASSIGEHNTTHAPGATERKTGQSAIWRGWGWVWPCTE